MRKKSLIWLACTFVVVALTGFLYRHNHYQTETMIFALICTCLVLLLLYILAKRKKNTITITIHSWRVGLQKVSLTKLQTEFFNIGLKEANENTHKLLDGEKIIIKTNDLILAKEFVARAEQIGAVCTISNDVEKIAKL